MTTIIFRPVDIETLRNKPRAERERVTRDEFVARLCRRVGVDPLKRETDAAAGVVRGLYGF